MHCISSFSTGKALAEPFGGGYIERRGFVIVEGTQSYIIHAAFAQGNEVRYDIVYLCGIENSVYSGLVYHESGSINSAKIGKIPR